MLIESPPDILINTIEDYVCSNRWGTWWETETMLNGGVFLEAEQYNDPTLAVRFGQPELEICESKLTWPDGAVAKLKAEEGGGYQGLELTGMDFDEFKDRLMLLKLAN